MSNVYFKSNSTMYDISRIYLIEPERIKEAWAEPNPPNPIFELGQVVDGDWDKKVVPFEDLDVYVAFRNRFLHNIPWNKTQYYVRVAKDIRNGIVR